ncbi:hypothetical protein EOM86_11960 [Candidatus Nomurabacteria bacterium]|nr:hypothetical protein [Candidatus Nomurabacteria bacterium]
MLELSRRIPATLLLEWMDREGTRRFGEPVKDSTAALQFVKDSTDTVLREKAVAGKAIQLNKSSLWDAHGFSNVCLILNGIPASVDYIPAVDPVFINYAVWELTQYDPSMLIGPESRRFISASLKTYDYPYPPDELLLAEDEFLLEYGKDAEKVRDVYRASSESIRNGAGVEASLEKAVTDNCDGMPEDYLTFVRYHAIRLLAADDYLRNMKEEYDKWRKLISEDTHDIN